MWYLFNAAFWLYNFIIDLTRIYMTMQKKGIGILIRTTSDMKNSFKKYITEYREPIHVEWQM